MENSKLTMKNVIQRCGCDKVLPLALVYIFYIMLHGHLSPGGGFQGGILTVGVVLLISLGHGYETARRALAPDLMHPLEGTALIIYTILAFVGVVFGASFCQNILYYQGDIGALFSSGTVFWMSATVAYDAFTASIVLVMGMLSILFQQNDNTK